MNQGDEEIAQRASTLDALFAALAEVRGLLQAHALSKVEEACSRAFVKFPAHPHFKAALAEAAKQKANAVAEDIAEVKRRVAAESDFLNQAAILREALLRFPEDRFLLDQAAEVKANLATLNGRIANARALESERSYADCIKAWESIANDYPWLSSPAPAEELERIAETRKKDKQDALDRWFRQVEDAIDNGDYETASTMLRQAAQQQSDRKLKKLEEKLAEGINRKQQSDAKLAEGKSLFADGDLLEGGKAILKAFELQPKDQEKANAIALLLLGQIRARMSSDFPTCETLLSYLKKVRPDQPLPPDLQEAFTKRLQKDQAERENTRKAMAQLSSLATEAESASSKRALSSISKKLQAAQLLDSRDMEVRRVAAELSRKINLALSGFETQSHKAIGRENATKPGRVFSVGTIVTAAILLLSLAGLIFFLSRPSRHPLVPVRVVVAPDRSAVSIDGQLCVSSDCKFNLRPGAYTVKLRKPGYLPKDVPITVLDQDFPLNVTASLEPVPLDAGRIPVSTLATASSDVSPAALAKIKIHGALPHTRLRLDGAEIGEVALDGAFTVDVPPGPHTLDLSLDGFSNRTFTRNFVRGESFSLANEAVQLEPQLRPVRR